MHVFMYICMYVLSGVYLGSNIGPWHWISDCVYSRYTRQPAGTDTGVVWTCSIGCTCGWRQLSGTWGI